MFYLDSGVVIVFFWSILCICKLFCWLEINRTCFTW